MVVTSTLGVEASHGHDIAADIDGGAAQPVVEMRFQLKYVFVCVYGGGWDFEMQQNNGRDDQYQYCYCGGEDIINKIKGAVIKM